MTPEHAAHDKLEKATPLPPGLGAVSAVFQRALGHPTDRCASCHIEHTKSPKVEGADAKAPPGDKPRLVQALVEERLLPALAPLRVQLEQAGSDPRVLIEIFVRGIGEVVARHPWLPPLWVREVLCDGGALREVLFAQAIPGVPQLLARRFAAAQAAGGVLEPVQRVRVRVERDGGRVLDEDLRVGRLRRDAGGERDSQARK